MIFRVHQTVPEDERRILFEWAPNIWGGPDYHLKGRAIEIHIVGYVDGQPVTHVGLVEQRVSVGSMRPLIGGIGGVVTVPEAQAKGYATACLQEAAIYMQSVLGAEYGLLFCQDKRIPFYESAGWQKITGPVLIDQPSGKQKVPYCTMVLELGKPWPSGPVDVESMPW